MNLLLRAIQEDVNALDIELASSPTDLLGERKQELTLGQIDLLVELLQNNQWVKEKYNTEFSELYKKVEYITKKQKSYIWFLVGSGKYQKLGEVLNSLQIQKI